jgi:hypothetical protein
MLYVGRASAGEGEGKGEGERIPTSLPHVDPVKHVYKAEAAELEGRFPDDTASVKAFMQAPEKSMPQLIVAPRHCNVTQVINSVERPPTLTLPSSPSSSSSPTSSSPDANVHVDPVKHVYKAETAVLDGRFSDITATVKSVLQAPEKSTPQLAIALLLDVAQVINSVERPSPAPPPTSTNADVLSTSPTAHTASSRRAWLKFMMLQTSHASKKEKQGNFGQMVNLTRWFLHVRILLREETSVRRTCYLCKHVVRGDIRVQAQL